MNLTSHYPPVDPDSPPDITTLAAAYDELRNDAARLHAMHGRLIAFVTLAVIHGGVMTKDASTLLDHCTDQCAKMHFSRPLATSGLNQSTRK